MIFAFWVFLPQFSAAVPLLREHKPIHVFPPLQFLSCALRGSRSWYGFCLVLNLLSFELILDVWWQCITHWDQTTAPFNLCCVLIHWSWGRIAFPTVSISSGCGEVSCFHTDDSEVKPICPTWSFHFSLDIFQCMKYIVKKFLGVIFRIGWFGEGVPQQDRDHQQ